MKIKILLLISGVFLLGNLCFAGEIRFGGSSQTQLPVLQPDDGDVEYILPFSGPEQDMFIPSENCTVIIIYDNGITDVITVKDGAITSAERGQGVDPVENVVNNHGGE